MTINDQVTEAAKAGAKEALAEGMVDILANVTRGVGEAMASLIVAPEPTPEPPPEPAPVPAPTPPPTGPVLLTPAEQTAFLKAIGLAKLPANRAWAIFQAAYNLGPALSPDGDFGPLTSAAARVSISKGHKISPNFRGMEFLDFNKGAYSDSDIWRANRRLLVGLEILRAKYYPEGIHIVSGYRSRQGNIDAGSTMTNSRHRYGDAADFRGKVGYKALPANVAPTLNTIGFNANGLIIHVDHTPGRPSRYNFRD